MAYIQDALSSSQMPFSMEGQQVTSYGTGYVGPEVLYIRKFLEVIGIADDFNRPPVSQTYDGTVSSMVQRFQIALGLPPTGQVDYDTWFFLDQYAFEVEAGKREKMGSSHTPQRETIQTSVAGKVDGGTLQKDDATSDWNIFDTLLSWGDSVSEYVKGEADKVGPLPGEKALYDPAFGYRIGEGSEVGLAGEKTSTTVTRASVYIIMIAVVLLVLYIRKGKIF